MLLPHMAPFRRWSHSAVISLLLASAVALPAQETATEADELTLLLQDATQKLRRGEFSAAEAVLDELLEAIAEVEPSPRTQALGDEVQVLLWQMDLRRGRYERVRDDIAAAEPRRRELRSAALLAAEARRRLGAHAEAIAALQALLERDAGDHQVRHLLAEALHGDGQRRAARELWRQNLDAPMPTDALQLAWRGRSAYRLGSRADLETASRLLVDSLGLAPDQAEARITLGLVKFAAYGETSGFPSGEKDLAKVLDRYGDDEEALLAMYRIRSANMVLDGGKTERFLDRVLARNERCQAAIVQRAANVLDDRRYRDAARMLDAALAIDANDRITLCHRAAAAWLLHDEAAYAGFRTRALAGDPGWGECDRILAEHLAALYRFADALPFFEVALQAEPDSIPALHGMAKALVYTGEGKRAKELLTKAKALAGGIVDAWRNNALAVQDLLDTEYVEFEHERFKLQLHRDDAEVLRAYLLPIQLEAAETLGAKYSWRPQRPTRIEVFHSWDDFSVRTIGFRGFTALGACFGSLVTLVSPGDSDLRRQDFMWEATAWHEYTHVLTLGVSNNRVPRWLTEGFSVYEEKSRDAAWERGMDRELFDAAANQDIPPVHLLNRLFRGPRILFGYYQGGLIVELIARDFGFDKALELLRAFGDDLDTDEAFRRALGIRAAEFDQRLLDFVQQKLRGIRLVPHLDEAGVQRAMLRAQQDATNLQARIDLAWACVHRNNPVDAGRWLAEVLQKDPDHGQALLVRAALLAARKESAAAIDCWRRGFAAGADDFDSRLACGDALSASGDEDGAVDMFQRAKACWPGCTDQESAPELRLAKIYRDRGEATQAQMEMKAYCRRTARAFTPRYTLAEFEREAGNRAEQVRYLVECNRIDPFHRELHVRLGEGLEALGKRAEAAREYEVAAAVLPKLDRRYQQRGAEMPDADAPDEREQRAELLLRAAKLRAELGDREQATALGERITREFRDTDAAAAVKTLLPEWRGR
jgi:tetratricopeptide (TPR) repeat protein